MAFVPAPGYQPVYNPTLPYEAPVPGGLWPGMAIYVQGDVERKPDRFHVNLSCGAGEGADVALHVNPRFKAKRTVLNSRRGGEWGQEQLQDLDPFARGAPFELVINVTPHAFRLLVNGSHFAEFQHRLPPEHICSIAVDGDLRLNAASVLGVPGTSPPTMPEICPPPMPDMPQTLPHYQSNLPMMGQAPTFHPPVPFVATIPGGLSPKRTIVVKGLVPPHADRFEINLRAGAGGDILLHFNPRLGDGVVVRNSLLGGAWGGEERDLPVNPFQRGCYFDVSIRCGHHRFKVFANGKPLCDFAHRVPPGPHVDVLEIQGDVVLSYVHF